MRLFRSRVPFVQPDVHLAQDDQRLRAVWDAVKAGDWRPAQELMAATRADFDRRARYVWVLGESTTMTTWAEPSGHVPVPVDTTAAWADRWAQAEPDNPDAILVRARSLIMRGWEVRGSDWASTVGANAFDEFHRLLVMSMPLLDEAARLLPDDPTPWVVRLLLASPLRFDPAEMEKTWAEIVARDPYHREAHNLKLMYLCHKWSGSHEAMFRFARSAAASAPHGSPLHVLPVQANAEWALWELGRELGRDVRRAVRQTWRDSTEFHTELDNAGTPTPNRYSRQSGPTSSRSRGGGSASTTTSPLAPSSPPAAKRSAADRRSPERPNPQANRHVQHLFGVRCAGHGRTGASPASGGTMLSHSAVEANIPAADLDRAREYYSDKLGLTPIAEYGGQALRYRTASGTFFNVYKTEHAGQAGHTIAQWHVDDVDQEVRDLLAKGVVFEVYEGMPGVEWNGSVATIPGMGKAAWFKDSEGNIMCVDEGPPAG